MSSGMGVDFGISGVVIVNKGEGITSQGVVNRIKRLLGVSKAGHTGTLDPLATGVLPVLVGRGVKASEFMLSDTKSYRATLLLGVTTDTEDVTGKILSESDKIPEEEAVLDTASRFVGKIMQTPPMYSAIKVGGKKLYELAREGKEIERGKREVEVYSLAAEKISEREYSLSVKCSKGTYIRTLCRDIGAALGCGGVMKALQRTEAAGFGLSESHTLEELEALGEGARGLVLPTEKIFAAWERVSLSPFFARLARCGQPIYLKKIGKRLDVGERVAFYDEKGFFALGEVVTLEEGDAIKPIRQFDV